MSKKPAAALSASLVAVKGAAAPAPDMPSRGASAHAAAVPVTNDRDATRASHAPPGKAKGDCRP
jgi:hypothetical protein